MSPCCCRRWPAAMPGGRRCGSCARPDAITATTRRCARGTISSICAATRQLATEVTLGAHRRIRLRRCDPVLRSAVPARGHGHGPALCSRGRSSTGTCGPRPIWRRLAGGAPRAAHMDFQARGARTAARTPAGIDQPDRLRRRSVHAVCLCSRGLARGFRAHGLDGLDDGLYEGFNERLCDLLAANMALQARAGADCIAIFDTAAGTLTPAQFARHAAAPLAAVVRAVPRAVPADAGDLLLARHRTRALVGAARTSICSASASTGATISSRY